MMQDVSLVASLSRLVVVALLMAAVLLVLRRTTSRGRASAPKRGPKRTIELVDRQSLGKTQSVAVLRVNDSMLVVGVTEQRVELLTVLDQPAADHEVDFDEEMIDLAEVELVRASARGAHLYTDGGEQFFERLRRRSAR